MNNLIWGYSLYEYLWFFFIYAFLGWCLEVAAHAVTKGKFINRGFLNGSYCPIYGFGVVIIILCLKPFSENLFILFLGSALLTTVLEFITGFVLKKIFGIRWWDYSDQPFNINGYICLKYSLVWGLACVFVIKLIQPLIESFVGVIPTLVGWIILAILSITLLTDFIIVVIGLSKITHQFKLLNEIQKQMHAQSDHIGEDIAKETLELQKKLDKIPEKATLGRRRLERAYPNLIGRLDEITNRKGEFEERINDIIKNSSWRENHTDHNSQKDER